jgi:1-aminocyclopropane-1-carboxylate deaminase
VGFKTQMCSCFVKRDDELGFSLSGSKARKYRSLISFFLLHEIQEVIVIGSAYSNHVLSITQLLIENHIQPVLFLKKRSKEERSGNFLLTSLFIEPSSIYWITKEDWPQAKQLADRYAQTSNKKTFVLAEGGSVPEALPGSLTLPLDIIRNEQKLNFSFDHLFIDSGTGMMASALLLGYQWLEKTTSIHIILIADDEAFFLNQLKCFHQEFEKLMKTSCPFPQNFVLHKPTKLAAFGSVNPSLFKEIRELARLEGFLTDPLYTAKLFTETKNILTSEQLKGNILINHSGGALTLAGFQHQLQATLNRIDS